MAASAAVVLVAVAAPAAKAAMSEWAVSEGGRMRLVAVSQPREGTVRALLQIEPKPGWKTYWRNPGDAGMPPQLDFGGSSNLALRSVSFPVPEIGTAEGVRFIGYHKPVSLVVEFTKLLPEAPATINLNAMVGICDKVCLPFMSSFSVPLTPDRQEGEEFMQLQLAEAELPQAPAADFSVKSLSLSPDRSVIEAEIVLPRNGTPEIAIEPPPGIKLGRTEIVTGGDKSARVRIPVSGKAEPFQGAKLTMLVKSAGRAIEATLALP